MSFIRFEAKPKELKQTANTSRKNPTNFLALKHQLQLNYRFISDKGFKKCLKWRIILQNLMHIFSIILNIQGDSK